MRLGAEPYMDATRRIEILNQISTGRANEVRVLEVIQSLPAWVEAPFQADQPAFNAALKTYQTTEPVVRNIENRLMTTPGPVWKELTQEELAALSNWSKAVDQLYAYVNMYFPSETQQYIGQVALLAIAVGAFLAPIFLDEPEKGLALPFDLEPPTFPSTPRAQRLPLTTAAPPTSFTPTSFSRIPRPGGTVGPSSPLRVQAEVMRPASPVASPWRRVEPAAASLPGASKAGYRTFTRPLDIPASRMQTPSEAASSATAPVAAAPAPHGHPTFPRFRRQ